ncbi:serine acetyltransferase [Bacteroides caecimuris]|uniref:serine acetyltransferase n=1 Tax=Bacteroides caecimuris TaxID=1796613 RepID=UPI00272CF12A|nr:serine acetyltransferase [Bacteroides caecimuris]
MNLRKIRALSRFTASLICSFLYLPHIILGGGNCMVISDLARIEYQIGLKLPAILQLIYHLHNNRYYRNLFYHRIGPVKSAFLKWYRPGDRYFNISVTTKIGESMWIAHPYATIINADSIGANFSCIHCTTIGAHNGRPILGDNVSLGCNVTIIGNVHIGNNVTIGAGSVVVKDLPDNCVAVGNPAKVVKMKI